MAGTLRISIEAVEGLRLEKSSERAEAPLPQLLVIEVGDGKSSQRAKPFEVVAGGNPRVNRVLFVPEFPPGQQLQVRAVKLASRSDTGVVVGEASVALSFGVLEVQLQRRQKLRGRVRLHVADGLPSPPARPAAPPALPAPSTPLPTVSSLPMASWSPAFSTPSSKLSPAPTEESPALAAASPPPRSLAMQLAGPRLPAAVNSKPLRMRPPGLPFVGNCDVVLEATHLPGLVRPVLVVGLEGQEFLAEDVSRCLKFMFQFAAVQASLCIYCYDAAQGQKAPLGRVLLPLADVLWPAGEAPSLGKVQASFQKEQQTFSQRYHLHFMPANKAGDSHTDASFVDAFQVGQAEGALGAVHLTVEITFRAEVKSLVGFYLASIVAAAKGSPHGMPAPALGDGQSMLESPSLKSLLASLWRLRHYCGRPSLGILRFLREGSTRRYVVATAWFLFCVLGFFPCSAWLLPLYAWLLFFGNGLLAAFQRQADWAARDGKAAEQFCEEAGVMEQLKEVEPWVRSGVLCLERLSNLFSFADSPASIASLILLAGICASLSLSLLIVGAVEGLSFLFGAYGAFLIVTLCKGAEEQEILPAARGARPPANDVGCASLFNQAFACVPDQAELGHRFVAGTAQVLEV